MEYRKNQRKRSLMFCITCVILFIIGITAGISFAYFSDSAKAENTLNFGKLKIKTGSNESVEVTLKGSNEQLAVSDSVTVGGSVGLEAGSVDAYIRMRMVVKDGSIGDEIISTFNEKFMQSMSNKTCKNSDDVDMKWFVANDGYMYLGNVMKATDVFEYNNYAITLTNDMVATEFEGISIKVVFTYQAIQSAGMNAGVTGSDYTEENAKKIAGMLAWNKVFEPELNAIYSSKYATEYVRGDLDETAYKAGIQMAGQMTKSPCNYFVKSRNNTGNYVAFGFFPQTIKASNVTVKDNWKETFNGVEYYKGSDGYLYEKVNASPYIKSGESASNMKFSNSINENDKIVKNKEYYFKLEPIVWEKRTSGNSSVYVSVCALIPMKFYIENESRTINGSTVNPNNYEHSYVRAYLNGKTTYGPGNDVTNNEYYNKGLLQKAFTSTQQNLIKSTKVDNSSSMDDRIFLLSESEANGGYYTSDGERVKHPTDYAGANGAAKDGEAVTNGGYYWLRTGSSNAGQVRSVYYNGKYGSYYITYTYLCVVPALILN